MNSKFLSKLVFAFVFFATLGGTIFSMKAKKKVQSKKEYIYGMKTFIKLYSQGAVSAIAIGDNGKCIVSGSKNGTLKVLEKKDMMSGNVCTRLMSTSL